tara:strand:+ start:89 stop:193 length:105 start_codon:yes stop_codon:yes gene_type:complete
VVADYRTEDIHLLLEEKQHKVDQVVAVEHLLYTK